MQCAVGNRPQYTGSTGNRTVTFCKGKSIYTEILSVSDDDKGFTPAVFIVCKKSSDGKTALPSYLIRNVRRMFPDVRITDADGQDGQFVYLKIPKQDIEWNTENYIKTLSENAALLLYGTQLKGSISAFETYASCRFAYFLEYGLKLSQREEYRFAVQDFGTVLHGVLEDVSRQLKEEKKSFSLLSDEERKKRVSESVVRIAAEYGNTI